MDFGSGLGTSGESQNSFLRATAQRTFYVDGALGNDMGDGSMNNPFQTIQHAIDMADESNSPGFDEVHVRPGLYRELLRIRDEDRLDIKGLGTDRWETAIGGNGVLGSGSVVEIADSADVRLHNMRVTYSGSHGVEARDSGYLYLNDMMVDLNQQDGLTLSNLDRVKISDSWINENRNGVFLEGANFLRVSGSAIYDNSSSGVFAGSVDEVDFVNSNANNNGLIGVFAAEVPSFFTNGSRFNDNDLHGVFLNLVEDIRINNAIVRGNGGGGVQAFFEGNISVIGGTFADNNAGGLEAYHSSTFLAVPAEPGFGQVSVTGGKFFRNGGEGVRVETLADVSVSNVDARWNNRDGVYVGFAKNARLNGNFLYDNGQSGVELFRVENSWINALVTRENSLDGLELTGRGNVFLAGGYFADNGRCGMNIQGYRDSNPLNTVEIRDAVAMRNVVGAYVNLAEQANFHGGYYFDNLGDGLGVNNTAGGMFQSVVSMRNGGDGIANNVGINEGMADGLPVPGSAISQSAGRGEYGFSEHRFEYVGGNFSENYGHGIFVSGYENGGDGPILIGSVNFSAQYVVARANGASGLYVDFGESTGSHTLTMNLQGGYFSHNQYDGIYLLGTSGDTVESMLALQAVDVVAEANGRSGIKASGQIPTSTEYFSHVAGRGDHRSLVNMQRGFYGFNGWDGINVSLQGTSATVDSSSDLFSVAAFDGVVSNSNGRNGVNLEGMQQSMIPDDDDDPVLDIARADSEVAPLIKFWNGAFSANGGSGIDLSAANNSVPDVVASLSTGLVSNPTFSFENVVASRNSGHGLFVSSINDFQADIDVFGGVFNSNGYDGIRLMDLRDVGIAFASSVANMNDGLHGEGNYQVAVQFNTFVANLNEDFYVV